MTESLASLLPPLEFDEDSAHLAGFNIYSSKGEHTGKFMFMSGARYQFDKMKSENELMRRLLSKALEQRDARTESKDKREVLDAFIFAKKCDAELIALVQEWKAK